LIDRLLPQSFLEFESSVMASAHSNIHRLRPRLRLVIDNADRRPSLEGREGRPGHDDPTPHPVGV
jgi:hypothetical protein